MDNLLCEIHKFKKWAMDLSGYGTSSQQPGEWECNYLAWNNIYTAFSNVISTVDVQNVEQKMLTEMVYIIARDNECEWLIHEVTKHVEWFEALCQCSLEGDEPDAKWLYLRYYTRCSIRFLTVKWIKRSRVSKRS